MGYAFMGIIYILAFYYNGEFPTKKNFSQLRPDYVQS